MPKPFVSIIIPTYKDWSRLSMCLRALSDQTYVSEFFEVIVVNNNPQDKMPEGYTIPENSIIIDEARPGSYAARNTALRIAKGEIIGFTDSDCIPDPDWIENAVICLKNDKTINRLAGPVKIFSKKSKPTRIELYDVIFAFPQKEYVDSGLAVTANLFTYRKIFDKVGPFYQNTMSGGDFEWGMRAQQAGFNIKYSEKVIINHPARDSLKGLFEKAKRVGKGQVIFLKENETLRKIFKEIIHAFKPKVGEVIMIFEKGENIMFFDKVYLVILRYLVLRTMDMSRISTRLRNR